MKKVLHKSKNQILLAKIKRLQAKLGTKDTWRERTMFEKALRERKMFFELYPDPFEGTETLSHVSEVS